MKQETLSFGEDKEDDLDKTLNNLILVRSSSTIHDSKVSTKSDTSCPIPSSSLYFLVSRLGIFGTTISISS